MEFIDGILEDTGYTEVNEADIRNNETHMQAKSIMALFETSKAERMSFVMGLLETMQNGIVDPLKVHLQVKSMEEIIKMLTDKDKFPLTVQAYKKLVNEAAKLHGSKFDMHNASFAIRDSGGKMDYSVCQDSYMSRLLEQQKDVEAKIKERAEILKVVPKGGMPLLDPDNGVVNHVYRPVNNTSSETVFVTLK